MCCLYECESFKLFNVPKDLLSSFLYRRGSAALYCNLDWKPGCDTSLVALFSQRSVGSDSQGRVTAANNQRELAAENKKPFKFLPLHVNTNKSRDAPSTSAPATPSVAASAKKQSPGLGLRDAFTPSLPSNDTPRLGRGAERGLLPPREDGRGELSIDSSQVGNV